MDDQELGVDHPRHDRRSAGVDDRRITVLRRLVVGAEELDPVIHHQHRLTVHQSGRPAVGEGGLAPFGDSTDRVFRERSRAMDDLDPPT